MLGTIFADEPQGHSFALLLDQLIVSCLENSLRLIAGDVREQIALKHTCGFEIQAKVEYPETVLPDRKYRFWLPSTYIVEFVQMT